MPPPPHPLAVAWFPRGEDVQAFLDYYRRVAEGAGTPPQSLRDVFGDVSPSTALGQLDRLLTFVSGPGDRLGLGRRKGSALDELFVKRDGVMCPTPLCAELAEQLGRLAQAYDHVRERAIHAKAGDRALVVVGAPHTITLRILSAALSGWNRVFGPGGRWEKRHLSAVEVRTELGNSRSGLIPRLMRTGDIDFVVSYGRARPVPDDWDPKLGYIPFDYRVSMALLCHPEAVLPAALARLGVTSPRDYWGAAYLGRDAGGPRPSYDTLAGLGRTVGGRGPDDVKNRIPIDVVKEFRAPLFYSTSWQQPARLERLAEEMRGQGRLRALPSYEECVAGVKMGQGITVVTETFVQREGVVAYLFDDTPPHGVDPGTEDGESDEEALRRNIGIYYDAGRPPSPAGAAVAAFIAGYFNAFRDKLKQGRAPSLIDPDYLDYCEGFNLDRDWREERNRLPALLGPPPAVL